MRSRKLVPAATAVISLLVLMPSSAFARRHHHHHHHHRFGGHCALSMNVAPRKIVAGDQVVVFGHLRCANPADGVGQEVKLFHHLLGSPGFTFVQSTTTDSGGFYEIVGADGAVESNRSFYVRSHRARSATKRVWVAAQVTITGPTEGQLFTGFPNRVTFTGTVSPADAGARVILQRQNATTGNDWHHIDSGVVDAAGNFTIVHAFIVPGDANIRVLVRSQRRNIPSISNVLAYSISQAQNPALTIQASADPIAFGEAVTISGKLASGVGQVTLLARSRRQHGFARVAQVSTNSAGEYSFPPQSPINSTFYRVQSTEQGCLPASPDKPECMFLRVSRLVSAVLYEGVRDVLSAQVSATTVQAGQSVTFSGIVSPDHTGHVIYLERQNAHDSGFHVIQVAFVGAASTYSIVHQLYVPGTKVLRVYIPGGPENQGAASEPFTIQVTPASASTLTPESPQNSTLPPNGQS
jgi:phage protein U